VYLITLQHYASAFGYPGIHMEMFIEDFRHVEIHIPADQHGNVVHLGERDCSIQWTLQKLIEETPSPAITPEIRKAMADASVNAAKAVNYVGAGTIEYIFNRQNNEFYYKIGIAS